jgi:hypothetical protein
LAADAPFEEHLDDRDLRTRLRPTPGLGTVRAGEVVRAEVDGGRADIAGGTADGFPATVDAVFGLLIDDFEGAQSLEVQWDGDLGYPMQFNLDFSDAFDDEVTYTVMSFES